MHIGKRILVKHAEKLQEGNVIDFRQDDLTIKLDSGETISRKYWEVRNIIEEK